MTKQAKYLAQSFPKHVNEEQFVQECQHFKIYVKGENNSNTRNLSLHKGKKLESTSPNLEVAMKINLFFL